MYDHAILLAVWVHLQVHPNVHLQTRGTYVRTETSICNFGGLMHDQGPRTISCTFYTAYPSILRFSSGVLQPRASEARPERNQWSHRLSSAMKSGAPVPFQSRL